MVITESCVECLWKRQQQLSDDPAYLSDIRKILDNRSPNDCSPYLVYLFNQTYEKHFGTKPSYEDVKKTYNDYILLNEDHIRGRIENSADPLKTAFSYARIGNYIDFGALKTINTDTLAEMLRSAHFAKEDEDVYRSFLQECQEKKTFLLIADNCGEIVLDKLFLEQLKKCYPHLEITVMVRGSEVLNDATLADAAYVGIDHTANVISSGSGVGGTICQLISEEAKNALDTCDVILAKGQGNYESLAGHGRHIYYSFLCKCDLFVRRFNVPKFTGMFIME